MLKKGNYVKIKNNTKIDSGEIVNNWAGEIEKIYHKEKCCLVSFDAQTIDALSEAFLIGSLEKGAEPFKYVFSLDEVELSERRDNDKELMAALERLASRMVNLEEEMESAQYEVNEKWIREFESSSYYNSLNSL
jgi:hypothetical protein